MNTGDKKRKKEMHTEIFQIFYNWYINYEGEVECSVATVGDNGVTDIVEYPACGEGDKWSYDIWYASGDVITIFNPNEVVRIPIEEEE